MLRLFGLAVVGLIIGLFVMVAWPVIVFVLTMWLVVAIGSVLLGAVVYLAEKR